MGPVPPLRKPDLLGTRHFEYVLETGAPWRGPVGKAAIEVTLADGLPRKDLGAIATAGSVEMGGGLRWTLTDLEPEQGVHVAVRRYVDLPDAAAGNLAEAAEMREPPGTLSLPPSFAIAVTGASTHDFAPSLIVTFLTAQHPMEVSVLAMQTGPRDLGAVPTPALTSALRADEALFG